MTRKEAIEYVETYLLDDKYNIEALETLIPELKKSENEKMKEAIIAMIHLYYGEPLEEEAQEMISWLEKQREKKHGWDEDDNAYFEFTKAAIENCYDENNPLRKVLVAWLEKQGDKDKLIQELGEYKVKYTQEVLEKHINSMSNEDNERLRKTTIAFLKDFADKGYENAVECIDWLEKQGEQKHKFNIGDIISNGQVVYRVDNIVKNCIGQDCYFLVNVEAEKKGTRDLMVGSHGRHFRYGEITWLCEQVDKSFEKKELKAEPKFKKD
jgi:hypothetical protein